jgi:hypothetical protein
MTPMQGDQQPTPPIAPNSASKLDLFNYLDQPEWLSLINWHQKILDRHGQEQSHQADRTQVIEPPSQIGATTGKISSISDRIAIAMAESSDANNLVLENKNIEPENPGLTVSLIAEQSERLDESNSSNYSDPEELQRTRQLKQARQLAQLERLKLSDRGIDVPEHKESSGKVGGPVDSSDLDLDQQQVQPISYVSYTTTVEAVINQITTFLDHSSEAEAKAFWLAIGQLQHQGRVDCLIDQVSSVVTNYYPDRLNTADSQVSRIFWQAARQNLTMPDRHLSSLPPSAIINPE